MSLADQIRQHEGSGCFHRSLGIRPMPEGYALMLDADAMYYYWLKEDGTASDVHWNKWAVYRGAVKHSESK